MGSSYSNIHVKSKAAQQVTHTLKRIPAMLPAYVAENSNNWFSIFPEEVEYSTFRQLCKALSAETKSSCIGLTVHDSDVLQYVICEKGKIVDEYNSWPEYFDDGDAQPMGAKENVLCRYCLNNSDGKNLMDILHNRGIALDGQSKAEELAKHFGIDTNQVHLSFSSIAATKSLQFTAKFIEATGEYTNEESGEQTGPPILVDYITYTRKNCTDDYELKECEKEWKAAAKADTVEMQLDRGASLCDSYESSGRMTMVCNNGGASQGVTIRITGGAIDRGLLEDWSVKLIPIPIGLLRECKLALVEPGVLQAECSELSFDRQINIEFDAKANAIGTDSFTIEVHPLQKDGQSSYRHEFWVAVRDDLNVSLEGASMETIRKLMQLPKKVRN